MIAARLYQNTAKVHFNQFSEGQGRFGAPAHLWRPCHLARARAELQRPRQRVPRHGDQRRAACRAALRRRHGVRLERNHRRRAAGPRRRRGLEAAHGRDQEPPLRRLPLAPGRGLRAERRARSRLLGARAPAAVTPMRLPADATLIVIDVQDDLIRDGACATIPTPRRRSRR